MQINIMKNHVKEESKEEETSPIKLQDQQNDADIESSHYQSVGKSNTLHTEVRSEAATVPNIPAIQIKEKIPVTHPAGNNQQDEIQSNHQEVESEVNVTKMEKEKESVVNVA